MTNTTAQTPQWIEVTDRHLRDFNNLKFEHYYELHCLNNGKIVRKCRESWNCDCPAVSYKAFNKL